MKKKVTIIATALMCAGLAAGCGNESGSGSNDAGSKKEITVTFMNGEEELGKVKGTAGEVISSSDYEKYQNIEDFDWNGWFETPTYLEISQKDLSKDTFEKDTVLYGYFKPNNITEDTRLWYVVGESSEEGSILDQSKWAAPMEEDEKTAFQLMPTGNNPNEFSITLDLHAGDKFQLIHDWQWEDQEGFGFVTAYDESCIENGGGLDSETRKSNISVLADGNYTITLTTNPDDNAQDSIVIVKN